MKALKQKLRSRCGETLAEALVSILIIGLCFAFLCASIVSAARINARAKNTDTSFSISGAQSVSGAQIRVNGTTVDGTVYRTEGTGLNDGYYYYQ